ncbi:hypothetical protein B0H67DRAFT_567601 [Lasiosphaeris hirsuta]|uniref:Fungal N-terminal domain-containing protein n=1 Tax=Lasiosphaeris hirsuta TaxID=260670 RepID=A0AA40E546_9PEZI|nr:hypothetical protein B0H67DRAFT_567601 [Lasiosphaeris hirsuta]
MDPFSLIAGCISITATIAETSSTIAQFVRHVRDARNDLVAIEGHLSRLKMTIELIQTEYGDQNNPAQVPENILIQTTDVLSSCVSIIKDIEKLLQAHGPGQHTAPLKWAVSGRGVAAALNKQLAAHTSTLQMSLEVSSLVISQSVKSDTTDLKHASIEIKVDTEQLILNTEQIMDEMTRLKAQVAHNLGQPYTGGKTDIINRYLDSLSGALSEYAGSVRAPSTYAGSMRVPSTYAGSVRVASTYAGSVSSPSVHTRSAGSIAAPWSYAESMASPMDRGGRDVISELTEGVSRASLIGTPTAKHRNFSAPSLYGPHQGQGNEAFDTSRSRAESMHSPSHAKSPSSDGSIGAASHYSSPATESSAGSICALARQESRSSFYSVHAPGFRSPEPGNYPDYQISQVAPANGFASAKPPELVFQADFAPGAGAVPWRSRRQLIVLCPKDVGMVIGYSLNSGRQAWRQRLFLRANVTGDVTRLGTSPDDRYFFLVDEHGGRIYRTPMFELAHAVAAKTKLLDLAFSSDSAHLALEFAPRVTSATRANAATSHMYGPASKTGAGGGTTPFDLRQRVEPPKVYTPDTQVAITDDGAGLFRFALRLSRAGSWEHTLECQAADGSGELAWSVLWPPQGTFEGATLLKRFHKRDGRLYAVAWCVETEQLFYQALVDGGVKPAEDGVGVFGFAGRQPAAIMLGGGAIATDDTFTAVDKEHGCFDFDGPDAVAVVRWATTFRTNLVVDVWDAEGGVRRAAVATPHSKIEWVKVFWTKSSQSAKRHLFLSLSGNATPGKAEVWRLD